MLKEQFCLRKQKPQIFQAMFLRNDKSQSVEIFEEEKIDFAKVQEHLDKGDSVFITSKNSQKLKMKLPKNVKGFRLREKKTKKVTGYCIDDP